jgi:hypothetical protein
VQGKRERGQPRTSVKSKRLLGPALRLPSGEGIGSRWQCLVLCFYMFYCMSSTTVFVVGSSHILLFVNASLPLLFHSFNIVVFCHPHALFFLSCTTAVSSSLHWPPRLDCLLPYEYLVYDVSKPLNRAIALSSTVQDVCTWARPRRRRIPTQYICLFSLWSLQLNQ